jgi:hypothetical protein
VEGTLDSLLDVSIDQLSGDELLDVLEEVERAKAALEARSQRILARLLDLDTSGKEFVAEEVACVLRLAPTTALARLHQAADLTTRLPRMVEMLDLGQTSFLHLKALAEATRDLDAVDTARAESRLLDRAETSTVGEFRTAARRLAARLDPRTTSQQHSDRLAQRRVERFEDEYGMATVFAYLSADRAAALMASLDSRAGSLVDEPGSERTIDQKRADVLADLGQFRLDETVAPALDRGVESSEPKAGRARRGGGRGPAIQVVVALSTLLGYDDDPADLSGHGPIPAAMARELAADPTGTWRRLITDTAGHVIDASRSYHPPPKLREHVLTRDPTCRFPGCRRRAESCEVDHVLPYSRGGRTAGHNLQPLCPRHHHLKHEGGWAARRDDDGTTAWMSPNGRCFDKPPDDPLAA